MTNSRCWSVALAVFLISAGGCSAINETSLFKLPFQPKQQVGTLVEDRTSSQAPGDSSLLSSAKNVLAKVGYQTDDRGPEAERLLQDGHGLFAMGMQREGKDRRQLLDKAAGKYKDAARAGKETPIEEDAIFWIGECHFFADHYTKATKAYDELVKKYPNSRHLDVVDKRRFATADYWLKLKEQDKGWSVLPNVTDRRRPTMDTRGHALKLFDRIRFDDPSGILSDDATMAAAMANYKQGRHDAADVLFDDLRENFPNSEHQFNAHLYQLECKRQIYDGPDYDGSALDDGEKLIKQMFLQFPDESASRRAYLEQVSKEIRLKKAKREFARAQYYDRRKEYGAARIAYARVKEEFSDTNLALEAETRLAQLGGKPDVPQEKLQWLADLFPREDDPKPIIR